MLGASTASLLVLPLPLPFSRAITRALHTASDTPCVKSPPKIYLQSIKLEYNYRAEKLPDTLKSTIFVPKPSKFQFDQTKLLSAQQKNKLVLPACTCAIGRRQCVYVCSALHQLWMYHRMPAGRGRAQQVLP